MAVEFLEPETASRMLVADTAQSLASHIIDYLSNPDEFEPRLAALHAFVAREFSWERRTAQLLEIVGQVLRARSLDRRPEAVEAMPSPH
jgi:glycosyltransferase involved in cell wall biosynthesis